MSKESQELRRLANIIEEVDENKDNYTSKEIFDIQSDVELKLIEILNIGIIK